MEKKSIRSQLMERLGITKEEAENLIKAYTRSHGGKANVEQMIKDVEKISLEMIGNASLLYRDYDVRHEITECGKDRAERGIRSLVNDEGLLDLAYQYLQNRYYENVHLWADAFYHSSQNQIRFFLSQGIDAYRMFVNTLPNKNIYRTARAFGMEKEIVEFIAENGTVEDFEQFMTDTGYSRNKGGKLDTRKCSKGFCKKVFGSVKEAIKDGEFKGFKREDMLAGLSIISNCKELTDEQKEELKNMYIKNAIRGSIDIGLLRIVAKHNWDDRFDTMKSFIEMNGASNDEIDEFLDKKLGAEMEEEIKGQYATVVKELEEAKEEGNLTVTRLGEILDEFGDANVVLERDEKTQEVTLHITTDLPITGNSITVSFDGTKFDEAVKSINQESLETAQEQLQQIVREGIGEVQLFPITHEPFGFRYPDGTVGKISDGDNSPYAVRMPRRDSVGNGVADYEVRLPYEAIDETFPRVVGRKELKMDDDEIEQFNNHNERVPVSKHSYRYGRPDGTYKREVLDIEIDGEQYHIKVGDYGRGLYTVVWKGQNSNAPKKAIGLMSPRLSGDALNVDEESLIEFISQNPRRFKAYYESHEKENHNGTGVFIAERLDRACEDMMKLETESELQPEKDPVSSELAKAVEERNELNARKNAAKKLLEEYRNLQPERDEEDK